MNDGHSGTASYSEELFQMWMRRLIGAIAVVASIGLADGVVGQEKPVLAEAEDRLKAIYERGQYRARAFRGEWLPDSSGYKLRERDAKSGQLQWMRYDIATGERTVLQESADQSGNRSPNGRYIIFRDGGGLRVRDLKDDSTFLVSQTRDHNSVRDSRATWSPRFHQDRVRAVG